MNVVHSKKVECLFFFKTLKYVVHIKQKLNHFALEYFNERCIIGL